MGTFVIEDPERIRLLGSPIRQDIVDYLDSAGPATVAELGRGIGVPADRLYYHVKRLLDAGLVVESDAGRGRGGALRLELPAKDVRIRYRLDDGASLEAIEDAVGTMLRSVERRFTRALSGAAGAVAVEGPDRDLWGSRVRGRLTEADVREVNETIRHLHAIFERRRGAGPEAGRMYEISAVLCPLPEPPE